MRFDRIVLGVAAGAVVLVSACGTATPSAQGGGTPTTASTATSSTAPVTTTPATTTTTVAPAPPPVTTTPPKPPAPKTTTRTTPKTTPKPKPKPAQAQGAPCSATADACIDLSANKSWLLQDGKVVYGPVPITHGRAGYRTPPGTFKVGWKNRDHKSSIFNNAPMPYSVFFNGGIAFHQGSLSQTSHGCIHLSMAAAKKFFASLQVGDVVQVVR